MAITSDNGSEMCRGLQLLQTTQERPIFHARCMAHIIKVAVKAAFRTIHASIGSLRNLISAIRMSGKRREKFDHLKNALHKLPARNPGLDVETRWSSTYLMLDAALDAKPVLTAMRSECSELDGSPSHPRSGAIFSNFASFSNSFMTLL